MKWRVTYVKEDEDKRKRFTEEVEAPTYTKAYLKFLFEHPTNYAITQNALGHMYNLLPVKNIDKFRICSPPTQYFATGGTVDVYVR